MKRRVKMETWLNSRTSDLKRMWSPLSHRIFSDTSGIVTPPGMTTFRLLLSSKITNLPPFEHLFTNLNLKSLAKSNPQPKASIALSSIRFLSNSSSISSKTTWFQPFWLVFWAKKVQKMEIKKCPFGKMGGRDRV